ncbi:nitrate ABC transporter permease [Sphaerisporangium krabiense]|uniref:ABC-type nitrate/sulfonate/bicarbonate transport system permease component n=1 Tax=Sphaerisporangium krabiense TaxID=763782 RepID=A0A7W8Z5Q4_9ACTN|nr:ABC transporter permease [Sphaerisporangium krabiense]MBB5627896.1 ABC-type nitrate/sulfonate/bicarbonate transport system permease component [Sphaerisporangium krabiense]GII62054.1 nitrate ABC transporter permease [Sphaerisporangium krabiense]
MTTTAARAAYGLGGFACLLVVMEAAPRLGLVDARFLPPASRILAALADELRTAELWTALAETLRGWAIGLAIAFCAAVLAGVVIDAVPGLRAASHSTVEFLRPIPSVALIPLATLLFGASLGSTLLLVVYASFWQVLIQVLYGVADVDAVADDTARSYGLSRWSRVRHVVWPTALPYVMTGLRLAAAVAFILAVTAELVIGGPGLGLRIQIAQSSGAVASMYALVVLSGLVGIAVNLGVRVLERRVLAWHPSVRGEAAP